ncbi:TerC family protein [Aquisalinus flavus]|uniref:TerC family protein n=1 Tax=Aquisalinus flavus TaxID=1526572 RepID=UPI00165FC4E2|nr:TerC family protein [Aquisalinus flavus]UNE49210.1 TerC family protein [Aquisalinus flavus]
MDYLVQTFTAPDAWAALAALIVMEVVLGIDNLIFISILTNKLPEHQRSSARRIGIAGALILRLLLLGTIAFIVQLTSPLFTVFDHGFSVRDLILIAGGLFLVWKATKEIHGHIEPEADDPSPTRRGKMPKGTGVGFAAVVTQILILDAVFSIDSILTAVGMTDYLPVMFIAVIVAVIVMLIAADPMAEFIRRHPTIVMLALGFLLLIGTTLIAEGFGAHLPKGYIYAAMAFSAFVEALNMMARKSRRPKSHAAPGSASEPPSSAS